MAARLHRDNGIADILTKEQLEQKYELLSKEIKEEYPKDQLMDRLNHVYWNKPQQQRNLLCLRTKFCSSDCHGSDCS